jgi:hypothetical protein
MRVPDRAEKLGSVLGACLKTGESAAVVLGISLRRTTDPPEPTYTPIAIAYLPADGVGVQRPTIDLNDSLDTERLVPGDRPLRGHGVLGCDPELR